MKLDLIIFMKLYKLIIILQLFTSYGQSSRVQNAKERILKSIHHAVNDDDDSDIDQISKQSSRTFQVIRQNRHNYNRYSGRRKLGPLFTPWTEWSDCDSSCKKRRERYCKIKRKCGYSRHIEEHLCDRNKCKKKYTNIFKENDELKDEHDQHHQQTSLVPAIQTQEHYPESHPTLYPTHPTPYPNPHANAYTPSYLPPTIIPTLPPTHHHYYHNQNHKTSPRHRYAEYEKGLTRHRLPVFQEIKDSDLMDDNDEDDFFVIKKRRPKYRKKRKPILIEVDDYEDLEDEAESDDDIIFNKKFIKSISRAKKWKRKLDVGGVPKKRRKNLKYPSEFDADNQLDNNEEMDRVLNQQISDSEEYEIDYDESNDRNATQLQPARERAVYEPPPKHRRAYSKWSDWTKCSPKCTTRRYKKCRLRDVCGKEVLREIAYCYTEGSFCQQWLQTQIQKNSNPNDLRPLTANRRKDDTNSNAIANDYIMSGKGYRGPEYTPMKLKCGIPAVRSTRRNMHNMLKIIGGKASRKGEWPWQVVIFNRFKEAFCGGTLIAPHWIVTAAHCVRKVLYVRLAEHNLDFEDGTEVEYRVMRSIKHPNYDKKTVDSDIALLRLPRPVNISTWIGYSCLPRPYQKLPRNIQCTVIGWGKRRNRDQAGTSVLHQAEVPIISTDNCKLVYFDYTITGNMFCAGHKRGRIDTCAGDSGGPLLCRDSTKPNHPWTIFGITSFGDGCAKKNKFGIYTKVTNYVDWIWSVINCNGNCKPNINNINATSQRRSS